MILALGFGCTPVPAPPEKRPPDGRAASATIQGGPLLNLADEAFQRGKIEVARERYKRVLAFDPQSGHALQGLARIALQRGQFDEARSYLIRATLSAPDSVPVKLALADLEAQTGNADAARAALEAAVVLAPANPVVHQQYLEFTGRAPRAEANNVDEALAVVDRHPYDPRARLAAGRWLAKAGRVEEATQHLETALW